MGFTFSFLSWIINWISVFGSVSAIVGRCDRSRSNKNEVNKCRDSDVDSHVVLILYATNYVDFVESKLRGNAVSHSS